MFIAPDELAAPGAEAAGAPPVGGTAVVAGGEEIRWSTVRVPRVATATAPPTRPPTRAATAAMARARRVVMTRPPEGRSAGGAGGSLGAAAHVAGAGAGVDQAGPGAGVDQA